MPEIEASESEFAEPVGYTSTPPAAPHQAHLLNDSEGVEVANNNAGLTQKIASETHDCSPRQPRLHRFPVRDPKPKKTKSFQASWYNRFDWLEYSVAEDAAFCYPCRKFPQNTSASALNPLTFVETGYKNWANALDANKGLYMNILKCTRIVTLNGRI